MNKKKFITKLSETTGCEIEKCETINNILESHFFPSEKGKQIVIEELTEQLKITEEEASHIYNQSLTIIKNEIKNKWKHPFN